MGGCKMIGDNAYIEIKAGTFGRLYTLHETVAGGRVVRPMMADELSSYLGHVPVIDHTRGHRMVGAA